MRSLRWLPGRSIASAFRADRWLLACFVVLAVTSLLPLAMTPLIPSPDLPGNVGSASLLFHTALRHAPATDFYRVVWQPFPYWTGYLFLGGATLLLGPLAAAKLQVGVLVLALPLAVMRLCLALGRNPRIALWAFAAAWEHNVYAGWHSYVLGMSVALVVVAKTLEARDDRAAWRVVPWSLLLVTTHVLPLGFALVALVLAALFERDRGALRRLAMAFSPTALVVVPWLWSRGAERASGGLGLSTSVEYPAATEKVYKLFAYSLDTLPGRWGGIACVLGFSLFLLGPMVLARAGEAERDPRAGAALAVPAAALLLYAAMPMTIRGPVDHWYTYPRFASFFLVTLPLVPAPRLDGLRGALVVLPGVIVALAVHVATSVTFRAFGERTAPFTRVLAAVPHGVKLLPLEYVMTDPSVHLDPLAHVHSYLTAAHVLYDPHLYDNPNTPIRYRPDCFIPRIPWLGPRGFSLERYGGHYDYVLVQGLESDPLVEQPTAGGVHAARVLESGMWRLYKLEKR